MTAATIPATMRAVIVETPGGPDALKVVQQLTTAPLLLITDVVMPGADGREVAEALTARFPGTPVLFTSGYTDDVVVHPLCDSHIDAESLDPLATISRAERTKAAAYAHVLDEALVLAAADEDESFAIDEHDADAGAVHGRLHRYFPAVETARVVGIALSGARATPRFSSPRAKRAMCSTVAGSPAATPIALN